jgi:cytochrome c553
MKMILAVLLLACAAVPAAQAQVTGNADAGKNKNSMCVGCHGIPMYKTAFPEVYQVPMIAGQTPQYIANALRAYKNGERSHPSMLAIAKSLTEQDMADLAAYYGGQQPEAKK